MPSTGRALTAALLTALGLTLGCSKGNGDKTDPPPNTPLAPTPSGDGQQPPTPGTPSTAAWEMDPAKHAVPSTPVSGMFAGAAFVPEVQVQGGVIRFRFLNKDGVPERQIELRLVEADKKMLATKITVKPDDPHGPNVPLVLLVKPGPESKEPPFFDKGYALTLELGQRQGSKVPGKVYLSLPNAEKDFLAGTFEADYIRTEAEPPGADDAPFIQGKLTVGGVNEPNVIVGYVRVEPYDPASPQLVVDLTGTILKPGGFPTRSEASRPRMAVLIPGEKPNDPARYEFTRLEPGRYWVFTTLQGGPTVSQWVTVAPGGQMTADFAIDAANCGGLEVSVPGPAEKVYVLPAAEPGKPWPEPLVLTATAMSGLSAGDTDPNKKDVKVSFAKLTPGKYDVWAGDMTGTIEVKRGETAKLDLMPPKK